MVNNNEKLNDRKPYKLFVGTFTHSLKEIINDDRRPMVASNLMQRYVEVENSDGSTKGNWRNNSFTLNDWIIRNPSKEKVKVISNPLNIKDILFENEYEDNEKLILPSYNYYNEFDSEEFSEKDLIFYNDGAGSTLSKERMKNNPILRKLANNDQKLLNEYVEKVSKDNKEGFIYLAMHLYDNQRVSSRPLVHMGKLEEEPGIVKAGFHAGCNIGSKNNKLVGIASDEWNYETGSQSKYLTDNLYEKLLNNVSEN